VNGSKCFVSFAFVVAEHDSTARPGKSFQSQVERRSLEGRVGARLPTEARRRSERVRRELKTNKGEERERERREANEKYRVKANEPKNVL
jgi:hypothetical protein